MPQTSRALTGLDTYGRRVLSDAESRARAVFVTLEKRAQARLRPLFRQFDFASRGEVYRLFRRVGQLERRLRQQSGAQRGSVVGRIGPGVRVVSRRIAAAPVLDASTYAELYWDEA